jgi:ABC-type branched-subunit amino acid transport system substrate-binding protein
MKIRTGAVVAVAMVGLLALAGCSSKAATPDNSSSSSSGVKTGAGISGGSIHLGMLVALSGPFAANGLELSNSAQLFWAQQNAKGGICGKYPVALDIKDNQYNVQTTTSLFSSFGTDELAFQGIFGSAPALALVDPLKSANMFAIVHGQSVSLLGTPNLLTVPATFDYEANNGLGYLLSKGLIKDGDSIGDIYLQGDYGEGALAGVNIFAKNHNLKVNSTQVTPAVSDLTPAVTALKSQNVSAIVVSGSSTQLGSVAVAAAAAGLDVPILASTPAWDSGLLNTPAAAALKKNLYMAYTTNSFTNPAATKFRTAYLKKYPGTDPTLQIILEQSEDLAMQAILNKACANGDLTPAGVLKARSQLKTVETAGIMPKFNFTNVNKASTIEDYIARAADVPGGLKIIEGPYASADTKKLAAKQ